MAKQRRERDFQETLSHERTVSYGKIEPSNRVTANEMSGTWFGTKSGMCAEKWSRGMTRGQTLGLTQSENVSGT